MGELVEPPTPLHMLLASTTLRCMKITSKILQFFCYDYFEDLLASITSAKNFGFVAAVVSKTFAIKNVLEINHSVIVTH